MALLFQVVSTVLVGIVWVVLVQIVGTVMAMGDQQLTLCHTESLTSELAVSIFLFLLIVISLNVASELSITKFISSCKMSASFITSSCDW